MAPADPDALFASSIGIVRGSHNYFIIVISRSAKPSLSGIAMRLLTEVL